MLWRSIAALSTFALVLCCSSDALAKSHSYTDKSTGMQVSVLKTVFSYKGEQFLHPKKGHLWLEIDAKIKNTSSKPQEYNPFDFAVVDHKGQTYNGDVILTSKPTLSAGKMPAHQFRSGWVAFEIPKSKETVQLTWDDGYSLDPPATIARINVP